MSRFEVTTAHWTMYIPSITFGIGSTLMDLDQLNNIQKPMMDAILPKMGYSSKTCRYVVFGPRNYLGIGATDLVTERGVQQTLMLVLKHIRSGQDLSKLLRIGLKWFQLHAGIARPILECPSIALPYLEVGWFQTLRKFVCFINAEIHIINLHVTHALRENDHTLMESFLETQHVTCTELYCLNLCRIYLRVEFLSEICNPEGDNILPEVWQGR